MPGPQNTIEQWSAFFSSSYQGWVRPPGGEWEDLIGAIDFECAPDNDDSLLVNITIVEFGTWTRRLKIAAMSMEGSTGQGNTSFKCSFRQGEQATQGRFEGVIFESPSKPLFEFQFVRNPD